VRRQVLDLEQRPVVGRAVRQRHRCGKCHA
jgi:hypothetical protein